MASARRCGVCTGPNAMVAQHDTHVCDTCWHAAAHIVATHPLSDPVGIEGLD